MFIRLLTSIVNASNHTKCVSLSNQKSVAELTHINLHPKKECCQELRCYPFVVNPDRCAGSCNCLDELSGRVWISNKKNK